MKELSPINQIKTPLEISQEQNKKNEYKLESSLRKRKQDKVFEINVNTLEVREAKKNSKETITFHQALTGDYLNEIVKNKDCVYIVAGTKKSALKRYKTGKGGNELKESKSLKIY